MVWPAVLRGSFVLGDEAAEDRSAFDPLEGQVHHGAARPGRLKRQAPVRPPPLVVASIFVQTLGRCRSPKISRRSGSLAPDGEHETLRVRVRARTPRRDLAHRHASVGEHRVERGAELTRPVPDQVAELIGPLPQVHQQVADLLGRPRPVRVRRYSEDVHVAAGDLDHEEDIEPAQGLSRSPP